MIKFLKALPKVWRVTRLKKNRHIGSGFDIGMDVPTPQPSSPFSWADSTFSVEVTKASNGHVLAVRRYDHRNDRADYVLRVCPAETPLHEEIAALFAEHRLTKG